MLSVSEKTARKESEVAKLPLGSLGDGFHFLRHIAHLRSMQFCAIATRTGMEYIQTDLQRASKAVLVSLSRNSF